MNDFSRSSEIPHSAIAILVRTLMNLNTRLTTETTVVRKDDQTNEMGRIYHEHASLPLYVRCLYYVRLR